MQRPDDPPGPSCGRRALLRVGGVGTASLLAWGGLTACGAQAPGRTADPATGRTSSAAAGDGDAQLVTDVRRVLSTAHARVAATADRHRDLRSALRPYERLQRRHAHELGGLTKVARVRPSTSEDAALAAVAAAERHLQHQLTRATVVADSGVLAATLASMVAALAQLRAVGPLDASPGEDS